MGTTTRPVLAVLIAAAVVVVGGLALQSRADDAAPMQDTAREAPVAISAPTLRGRDPVLAPASLSLGSRGDSKQDQASSKAISLEVSILDVDNHVVDGVLHVESDFTPVSILIPREAQPYRYESEVLLQVRLRAEARDASLWSETVEVDAEAGTSRSLKLQLVGRRFRGRVVDARTGEPVQKALVCVCNRTLLPLNAEFSRGLTTGEGEFDFSLSQSEPPLSPDLHVTHRNYLPGKIPRPVTSEPVEIRLKPRVRLTGSVRLPDSSPAASADILLHLHTTAGALERADYERELAAARRDWEWQASGFPFRDFPVTNRTRLKTQRDGSFELPLEFPGEATGFVLLKGHLAERFEVDARRSPPAAFVTLRPCVVPDARIRFLRADGSPFAKLSVRCQEHTDVARSPVILYGTCDDDGWLDTSQLPEGQTVRLSVSYRPPGSRQVHPPPVEPFPWVVRYFETITIGSE